MAEKTVATPVETREGAEAQETTREQVRFVTPPVDIYETEDALVLLADLPGVTPERLTVSVNDNILTIEGRTEYAPIGAPIYWEFELPSFYRQFQLSEQIDTSRISAKMKNGVLTLTLPKAEVAKPKTIKVQVG